MTFTSSVIFWCVAVPAIISMVAAVLCNRWIVGNGQREKLPADRCCQMEGIALGLGWWFAITVTLAARQWFESDAPWLERMAGVEAWQQATWPLLMLAMLAAFPVSGTASSIRYVGGAVVAAVLAFQVIPAGEGWEDLQYLHRPWSALIVASVVLNAYALDRLIQAGAAVWSVLVMLAGLAPAVLLGAISYAAPAEWSVSALSATAAVFGVAGWNRIFSSKNGMQPGSRYLASTIVFVVSGVIATGVATSRFYTWEEYPKPLYAISMFLPTAVALVDAPIRKANSGWRISVAALVSGGLIFYCIWHTVLQEPADSW